jgi:hypothetical protein
VEETRNKYFSLYLEVFCIIGISLALKVFVRKGEKIGALLFPARPSRKAGSGFTAREGVQT